jgi:hypothetical protein
MFSGAVITGIVQSGDDYTDAGLNPNAYELTTKFRRLKC